MDNKNSSNTESGQDETFDKFVKNLHSRVVDEMFECGAAVANNRHELKVLHDELKIKENDLEEQAAVLSSHVERVMHTHRLDPATAQDGLDYLKVLRELLKVRQAMRLAYMHGYAAGDEKEDV